MNHFADILGVMQEGMLARFAMALQRGQIEAIGGQGFGGEEGTIVVDDNCQVCLYQVAQFWYNAMGNADWSVPDIGDVRSCYIGASARNGCST